MRDPRTEPKPGDVLADFFDYLTITKVTDTHVYYRIDRKRPKSQIDRIPMNCKSTVKRWLKFATLEVLHAAD